MSVKHESQQDVQFSVINKSVTILDLVQNKPNNQLILNILFTTHQLNEILNFTYNYMIAKYLKNLFSTKFTVKITQIAVYNNSKL
ncbi:hypothetical protein B4901_18055 [Yersinia frederiksenii]|nr:hypothetical protein B4901_18055 [Yersinia frederiksenii]OWF82746.1 hypothetical protein B4903_04485 [Yersinia frederiksenii]